MNSLDLVLSLWFVFNFLFMFAGGLIGWSVSRHQMSKTYQTLLEYYQEREDNLKNLKLYR